MAKTYHIFVSHSWTYSDAYDNLVKLLDARPYFSYKNYSVPKDDPIHDAPNSPALYEAIKRQMSSCHIVLVLAGVYSTYSTWINKEIKIAQKEFTTPKPIVGIKPWAQSKVSSVVSDAAEEIVGWSTESIVSAIRLYSL